MFKGSSLCLTCEAIVIWKFWFGQVLFAFIYRLMKYMKLYCDLVIQVPSECYSLMCCLRGDECASLLSVFVARTGVCGLSWTYLRKWWMA